MKNIYIAFSLFLLVFAVGFAISPAEASANSYHYHNSHYPVYGYGGDHYDYGNPYCYDGCMGYVDHNYYSADNYPSYLLPTTGPIHYNYYTNSGNCGYSSCGTCGYSSCNNNHNYGNSYGYSDSYNNSYDYSYGNNYNSNDYQDYSYGNSYSYGYGYNNGGYYGYGY